MQALSQSFWPQARTCDGSQPRESSLVSSAVEAWAGCQQGSGTTEDTGRGRNWGGTHGQRSLVGYGPWDRKESDTTEVT